MVTGVTKLNVTPVRFPQNAHFWLLITCIIAYILTRITTGLEIYYDSSFSYRTVWKYSDEERVRYQF